MPATGHSCCCSQALLKRHFPVSPIYLLGITKATKHCCALDPPGISDMPYYLAEQLRCERCTQVILLRFCMTSGQPSVKTKHSANIHLMMHLMKDTSKAAWVIVELEAGPWLHKDCFSSRKAGTTWEMLGCNAPAQLSDWRLSRPLCDPC